MYNIKALNGQGGFVYASENTDIFDFDILVVNSCFTS
jgi:hypothetical protein